MKILEGIEDKANLWLYQELVFAYTNDKSK